MTQLQWVARDGRRLGALGSSGPNQQLVLSKSGKRVALQKGEISPTGMETVRIWTMELTTGIASRINSDSEIELDPAWSPDERSLAFTGRRRGVYTIIAKDLFTSGEQALAEIPFFPPVDHWAPDGRIIFHGQGAIRALAVSAKGLPQIVHSMPGADQSHVSPDSRWIAFNSDESGRWEVYVARFPDFTDKRPISNDGGVQPLWRSDGRELFYFNPRGQLMSVAIKSDPTTEFGVPRKLFDTTLNPSHSVGEYGVTPNGDRFLVLEPVGAPPAPLEFVLNWRLDPAAK
jgi:serine/threonine-protein kinase